MQYTGVQSSIVEALIQHHDWFFPGEIDFTRKTVVETNGSVCRRSARPSRSEKGPKYITRRNSLSKSSCKMSSLV